MQEFVTKSIPFTDAEFKVRLQTREFEGFASTTGNMDLVGDIIEPGSFRKTIAERGPKAANKIKVLWDHFAPFGMPAEMREEDHGLHVVGKAADTQENKDRLQYMADGVVDSMSIGFSIPEGKSWWEEDDDAPYGMVRHITEVKLYEFSPVMFPANELAVISGVRKQAELALLMKSFDRDDLARAAKRMEGVEEKAIDEALEALGSLRESLFGIKHEAPAAVPRPGETPTGDPVVGPQEPGKTDPDEAKEIDAALQSVLDDLTLKNFLGKYETNR